MVNVPALKSLERSSFGKPKAYIFIKMLINSLPQSVKSSQFFYVPVFVDSNP